MTSSEKKKHQPSDVNPYDGHVDFKSLTPEQKLAWLASIVILAKMSRKVVS